MKSFILLAAVASMAAVSAPISAPARAQTYLGQYSANPHAPKSSANPAQRIEPDSVTNSMGRFGSPFGAQSAANPYATDAPKLYDGAGHYRGKLSANPYDPDSISNPYGRYGSRTSPDSVNNPFGAGNPFAPESPHNRFGTGLRIMGKE